MKVFLRPNEGMRVVDGKLLYQFHQPYPPSEFEVLSVVRIAAKSINVIFDVLEPVLLVISVIYDLDCK